jgi:SM-20-related protein
MTAIHSLGFLMRLPHNNGSKPIKKPHLLNPSLNLKALRKEFARDRKIRIADFLVPEVADSITDRLQQVPFELVYVLNGKTQTKSREKMAALSVDEKKAINQAIMTAAGNGEGYLYGSCHLGVGRPKDLPAELAELFDYLKGESVMALVRQITGENSVNDVTGHYTRYIPGHFLTRHRDTFEDRNRKFAYVLGFTRNWHPDWGGLLQFYREDGTPREAWSPLFNSLTLFDVSHIHAVTYVSPFAKDPRYSLTGWFNSNQKLRG